MTTAELKNAIKTADFNRCFVFGGEEEYLKRFYIKELRRVILCDDFASFNHFVFEGERIDFSRLYDAVASPPMMSEYKLVEWHLANFNSLKDADVQRLEDFCRDLKDYPYSCVIFSVGHEQFNVGNLPKKPTKLYNAVNEAADVIIFGRSTDAQLLAWIQRHIQHEGLSGDASVCRAILAQCGHDMDVLSSEIEKLCAYAKANGMADIDEKTVGGVCSSVTESDAFGLSNAILSRNKAQAFDALLDMKRKKIDPTIVLGSIFKIYTDINAIANLAEDGMSPKDIAQKLKYHEYKVNLNLKYARATSLSSIEKILMECKNIDVAVKTSMVNAYTAIEKFIAAYV